MKREGGFALIAVLLVLALLAVVGAEFAYSMRLEASAMRAWRDGLAAAHLAEAAVEQAIREITAGSQWVAVAEDGALSFYTAERIPLPRLPRTRVPFGPGEFSYEITDEQARINVNSAQGPRLDKVLQCLGVDKVARDKITDAIADWIDSNEEHRANGAESDDHYLLLPTPYRARNAPLESLSELLQIKGITQALYDGVDGKPGLADLLTVRGLQVNVNTAGPVVLCGMGAGDALISEVVQGRLITGVYATPPSNLNLQGLTATTGTFRIEAQGFISGRPRARVTTIVQRRTNLVNAPTPVLTLEWSGIQ